MLNDLLTDLTKQYHEVGHVDPAIDQMIDMDGGFGHRVEFGHDLDGFLRAYNLEGFDGVHSWADHMLKDFTSHDGIPLPFAEALVHLTPLDLQDAVDWLSVNTADFAELGAEAVAVHMLEKRFEENPKAYHLALAAGLALGFIDDNPLLIAFSGAKWLGNAKKNVAAANPEWGQRFDSSIESTLNRLETVSYWALGADVVAHVLHLADVAPFVDHLTDGIPIIGTMGDIGEGMADTVDGFASFGLVFLARRAVRKMFSIFNGVKQREAARLAEQVRPRMVLAKMLEENAPTLSLVGTITEMKALPPV